jgi:hypothetical protein
MRYLCILVLSFCCFAQQSASSVTSGSTPDLNGGFSTGGYSVATSKSPTSNSRTEYAPNANGSLVPRETIQEKIIRQDANGRVVERLVRRHDQDGNPGPLEKQVIEEKKSGNTVVINTLVYRGDINGNMSPAERSTSQIVTQGQVTTTQTTIERTGLDGSLTPAEKINSTVVKQSKTQEVQTVTKLYRDASGNYYEGTRDTTERQTQPNGKVIENRAEYVEGVLSTQAVSQTVPSPDGSATTTVDVYSIHGSGTTVNSGGKMALKEQQQIIRQAGPNGQITETVVSRKPTVAEPNRLGPAQVLSKSVCQGNCKAATN